MRNVMAKMFIPPAFADPEQTRSARWLNAFLLIAFLTVASYFVAVTVAYWMGIELGNVSPLAALGFIGILIGIWGLMHQGLLRLAILITLITLFVIPTYLNLAVYQSLRSPDVWVYFILIPLTGLLLGRKQMLYGALLCLLSVAILFYLETTHFLTPNVTAQPTAIDGILLAISILLSTLLMQATIRKAEAKGHEAQRSLAALRQSNDELERSQAALQQTRDELELRVDERTKELRLSNQRLQNEIYERQRLMEALRNSEANWRSLVQNAPELIATMSVNGKIRFANRGVGAYASDELLNQPISVLHTQECHQQMLASAVKEVITTGKTVSYESEEQIGEQRLWRINRLGPIYETGNITALILIATDITEQKQTETAMLQAQKLESLGLMAGGVAHDFNNLLTAIIGQASLAMGKLQPEQQPAHKHLQNLLVASQRATELTRQMLNYAGHTPPDFVPVQLNRLLVENIQFFSASIAKTVDLQSALARDLPEFRGDPGQIQQLVMNLILNAADAIGEQVGEIVLATSTCTLDNDAIQAGDLHYWNWTEAPLAPGQYIKLSIADTGCGMDNETIKKIFDPFFTTKFTGRGLGLASVLGIVRSHNAAIHVSSTVGVGTTFEILFPVATPVYQEEEILISTYPPVGLTNKLVLLIDDEEDVRQVTSEILELSDIRTLDAANGIAGLRLFEQHAEEIDLVLLDLSMPGMNGEEVVRRLWALKPGVRILLLSGYDEYEVTRRLGTDYQVAFLQKPYNVDGLLRMVEKQLTRPTLQPVAESSLAE